MEGGIGKYLGLPEHFCRRKRDIFASIIDRIRQKAHSWTAKFLSGAGKQIMLRSVLSAMPCYAMSCFKLPVSLCRQIQSILTRFWWGANPEKNKMCWVAWTTMALPKYAGGLGFRDIETFNDALLAKIGWRIIKDPQSLLARVLLGKYAKDSSFMDCDIPASASHGWRSILAGREILRKGLGWAVGNGESIGLWSDPWLSFNTPCRPIGPATAENYSMKVSELLCPFSNQWDVERIQAILPQYEGAILGIKTSATPSLDTLLWLPERSGIYSTKTGYGIGMIDDKEPENRVNPIKWLEHVWKVKTAPKLKDFLWRVLKKAIPVSSNLESRGVASFACKKCGAYEDNTHVFLHCPTAEEVWSLIPVALRPSPTMGSPEDIVKNGAKYTPLPPVGLTSPIWPWVMWNLWKARNKLIFENRSFTAREIALKSVQDAKEWNNVQVENMGPKLTAQSQLRTQPQALRSPPTFSPDILVCSVDAAWDVNTGRCGIGGVLSGSMERPGHNLSEAHSYVSSALMAEAIAVRLAVSTAVYSNVRSLAVLSDSLSLINLLKKGGNQPKLFGIMFDIHHYLSLFDSISFHFISRNFNVEADSVAKLAFAMSVTNSIMGV